MIEDLEGLIKDLNDLTMRCEILHERATRLDCRFAALAHKIRALSNRRQQINLRRIHLEQKILGTLQRGRQRNTFTNLYQGTGQNGSQTY